MTNIIEKEVQKIGDYYGYFEFLPEGAKEEAYIYKSFEEMATWVIENKKYCFDHVEVVIKKKAKQKLDPVEVLMGFKSETQASVGIKWHVKDDL